MIRKLLAAALGAGLLSAAVDCPRISASIRVYTAPESYPARTALASTFAIRSHDVARIDAGHVFSRTLDVTDSREVATLGIVRVTMTPDFYVSRLADIAAFKRDDSVLQIGAFSDPPRLEDVATLTLDESDLRSLRECRVGRCGVQLSAEAIRRFGRDVQWGRPDASIRANEVMRQVLVDYVTQYRSGRATSAMQYADVSEPVDVRREFASLVQTNVIAWPRFPQLLQHLVDYPVPGPTPISDVIYWSKEKVGRRPVVSITHVAIARLAGESAADYAIASKQIYGSHYFDASLGLTVLVQDRSGSAPATYLGYFNRSRVDVFGGLFGGVTRRLVTSRAQSTVTEHLGRLQRNLGREFAAAQTW
jgi:hypothetical protein